MSDPLRLFRAASLVEGISYLLLLFVAMPLKYLAGLPQAVTLAGRAHGALFVLFAVLMAWVFLSKRLSFARCVEAFVASLLPFGAFWFESRLRREDGQRPAVAPESSLS